MVVTFMDGLHPRYRSAFQDLVDETIDLLIADFSEQVRHALPRGEYSDLRDEMAAAKAKIGTHFQDRLQEHLKNHHSDPIMSIVELLPKEELAEMAEALVNLTSFKRRVSPEAETVGGPVDVAVISKGDGLVWIQRKHYFSSEFNPRYISRNQMTRI